MHVNEEDRTMSERKWRALAQVRRKLEALVREHGFAVVSVGAAPDAPEFTYTVGLADEHLPELLVIGLPAQVAHPVLNVLATRLRRERALPLEQPLGDVFAGMAAVLQEAPYARCAPYVRVAAERQHGPIRVLQLIWPDQAGRFPWETGYDMRFLAAQPLLARH
jgi:hypothetical protein